MDEIDRDQEFNEQQLERLIACARSVPEQTLSRLNCQSCGDLIPEKRRQLIPGVSFCTGCQAEQERNQHRWKQSGTGMPF